MQFLRSFLKSHFAVKTVVASRTVGCFLRLDGYEKDRSRFNINIYYQSLTYWKIIGTRSDRQQSDSNFFWVCNDYLFKFNKNTLREEVTFSGHLREKSNFCCQLSILILKYGRINLSNSLIITVGRIGYYAVYHCGRLLFPFDLLPPCPWTRSQNTLSLCSYH